MTLTVNGQPASPGCYVEGHWGQYGPDHFVDRLEGFGLVIPKGIDPRRDRRIIDWITERATGLPHEGPLANAYLAAIDTAHDQIEQIANDATEGGYWEWYDGECFLRSYVCPDCGRDATDEKADVPIDIGGRGYAGPCDYCCDADDPGCFA